jgi:predicted small lipoprotein YifL
MPARRGSVIFLAVVLFTSGCGKKGPLIYPDMLIAQPPQHLSVEQVGSALRLSFDVPAKDLAGRKLEDLEAIQVARRVYQNKECTSCLDPYHELQRIVPSSPAPAQRQGNRIIWTDSDVRTGKRYQYRLNTVQTGGVTSSPSTTGLATVQPPPEPPVLKARPGFGGLIVLEVAGKVPEETTLVGYTIYRTEGAAVPQLLATLVAGQNRYEDQEVQRGTVYRYTASIAVKRDDGLVAVSEPSATVSASVVDDPN